jgi:hypothetical protein
VGWYDDAARRHGFLLDQGSYTTLDVPGAYYYTEAYGINASGLRRVLDGTPKTLGIAVGQFVAQAILAARTDDGSQVSMYWADWTGRDIRRANLDGSDQQILISGLNCPGL